MLIKTLSAAIAIFACTSSFLAFADEQGTGEDPVVAIVDNQEIYLSDVMEDQGHMSVIIDGEQTLEDIFPHLLDHAIENMLIRQAIEKEKLGDDPEVQPILEKARIDTLVTFYLTREIEKGNTEEALMALYQASKDDMVRDELRVRQITVAAEEDAKAVLAALKGGADFATLAKEWSSTPDAVDGGDLGYVDLNSLDMLDPAIADAAFSMDVGSISSEPVKSDLGFHVLKLEDKRRVELTFEESRPQLELDNQFETEVALYQALKAKANIERFNLDGSPMTE